MMMDDTACSEEVLRQQKYHVKLRVSVRTASGRYGVRGLKAGVIYNDYVYIFLLFLDRRSLKQTLTTHLTLLLSTCACRWFV